MMKHTIQVISAILLACSCMMACKKSMNTALRGMNAGNAPNFYIAGQSNSSPCLWINGTKNVLSGSAGNACQVLVNGSDVYVAGWLDLPTGSADLNPGGFSPVQYVYWKNGAENKIGGTVYEIIPLAPTISIVGNNVYYANRLPWENSAPLDFGLSNEGFVQMVTSDDPDVYFVGTDGAGKMAYWKNGIENSVIPNETGAGAAYSIAVSSGNVYVGGADSPGTVWTNGIPENLHTPIPGSYAVAVSSLFASGADIYAVAPMMAPTYSSNGNYFDFYSIPAYWKNGLENDLPLNGDPYGNANSVFVSGSDVYVCGRTASGAVYWKNGTETVLGPDYGAISSILIQ
jgi:hypothetical protein